MVEANVEQVINTIMWGKSICDIKDDDGEPRSFILRSLSIKESNLATYIYDREFELAKECGLLLQQDLEDLYKEIGIWTQEHDMRVTGLKARIKALKPQVDSTQMVQKHKQVKQELEAAESSLEELISDKSGLFQHSAESRAEEIKRRYMVMLSTESRSECQYWPTEKAFLNETDHPLILALAIAYYTHNLFDEPTIRKVARSPSWRYRWRIAKSGADLFGKPIADWSEMQNMLVYWSQYYDYVLENPDMPTEAIINNDGACDAWVEEQTKKYSKGSTGQTKTGGPKSTHQEQFIMVQDKGNKEEIRQIQEMNAPSVRQKLRYENSVIKKKGKISEWKLRRGRLPNGEYSLPSTR